jgi:ATP10 protein
MIFAGVLLLAMASTGVPLHVGDALPVIAGETTSGKTLALPPAAAGKAAILVFSFSRAGGNDAHIWNDHVAIKAGDDSRVPSFTVMMLESVPRVLRGMVASSIRKQMPAAMYERCIVVFRDEAIWKQRFAASDLGRAYVLLIDGGSRICWMNSGPFSDSAFQQLREAVLRVHPPPI